MTMQIAFQTGVTLAGGAPFSEGNLHAALVLAPHPIAVDGGADGLSLCGIVPQAVIGDMDSVKGAIPEGTRRLHITEQETTDFGKCLGRVTAPLYVGVGFLGGRLDHTLAALSVLLEHAEKRVVLLGEEDVAFVAPPDWAVSVEPGARVSFFPLMPCRGVASSGLRWPVEGLEMQAGGQIGTSNEAVASRISASFDPPAAITILPKRYLGAVVESLGVA